MPRSLGLCLSLVALCALPARSAVWLKAGSAAPLENQRLSNPGLEQTADGQAAGWGGWQAGYQLDTQVRRNGAASARCRLAQAGTQAGVMQTATVNQTRPTALLARCWSRAENVSGSPDSNYSLYLDLEYTDGTPLWGQIATFETGTHDWQPAKVLVLPDKPVKSVTVIGLFRGHDGTAWFDDFELYELPDSGSFDYQPVTGKLPAGPAAWQSLPLGPRAALSLDPATGAMSLDATRSGGLVLRDVAADSPFVLPQLATRREGEQWVLEGDCPELKLRVKARLSRVQDGLRLDGNVSDTTGQDRAISVYWALPMGNEVLNWADHPRASYPVATRPTSGRCVNVGVGANGKASHYPFGAVFTPERGLAVGAPLSEPRLCRFAFDQPARVLYAAFDLGLSAACRQFASQATFSALLYPFDAAAEFRGALDGYYRLQPAAFANRVKTQGIWMPFQDIATVQGWEDFGFQFQEGAPNPAWDEEHGIGSYPYIEPMSYWMAMPPGLPRTQEAALKLLGELAAKGDKRAQATLTSGLHGPDGRPAMSIEDAPWCNGALFLLNPTAKVATTTTAPRNQYQVHEETIANVLKPQLAGGTSAWGGYGAGYELVAKEGRRGSRAARCQRAAGGAERGLHQSVGLAQKAPRPIQVSAWSRADGVSGEPSNDYSLYCDLVYNDGSNLWGQVVPFAVGTHDWQQVKVTITPAKPVLSVSVHLLFRGEKTGTVWFDDVSLKEADSDRELIRDGDLEVPSRPVSLDGLYLDSFEMAATVLNYRREHFATASLPLVFDSKGRVCLFGHFMAMEFLADVTARVHGAGKLMFANAVLWGYPWPAAHLDIFGTETNWNAEGKWQPLSDETMLYWRAMCYGRPYLTLQNTDFTRWTKDMTERYFARCALYAVLPSFFSADAATKVYWAQPALYNRDRDLFKAYLPPIRRLAEAGWQPLTGARSSDPAVYVERYGQGRTVHLAVFNSAAEAKTVEVSLTDPRLSGTPQVWAPRGVSGQPTAPRSWRATLQPEAVAILTFTQP